MLSYLKSANLAVSKPRGRPPKKAPAEAKLKGKLAVATTKKRSPSTAAKTERASKIQKTVPKANSGKRVNGSVADAFDISDNDDDDFDLPRQLIRTDSLTPAHKLMKIASPGSEDDLKPVTTSTPTPTLCSNLENELIRMKVTHAKEVEQLRQEIITSEAKVKQVREDAERKAIELQRRKSVSSDKLMADLEEELEIERRMSIGLTWECDHIRREMEAARSCLKGEADLIQQRDEYERLYKEEQDTNADLMRGLVEKDKVLTRKATEMGEEIQQLARQIENFQREVTELRNENAALKISSATQAIDRIASPSPSQSSSQSTSASDAELRLVNIRKTYIVVKRRYDNLHSVAANISTATRSWDYGSFGEFGLYLRQLKTALDENGPEEQSVGTSSQVVKVD